MTYQPEHRRERPKSREVVFRVMAMLSVVATIFCLFMYRDTLLEQATNVFAATNAEVVPLRVLEAESFRLEAPATGEIVGMESVPIATPNTQSGGLSVAWLIEEGSFVTAGQVVLRFDSTDAALNLEREEKALESNQERTKITNGQHRTDGKVLSIDRYVAESEYDYAIQVLPEDETIFSKWDIIEAQLDADSAKDKMDFLADKDRIEQRVAKAEQQILAIERNKTQTEIEIATQTLNALEIRAPVDGLAVYRRDRNREPQLGDQCWPGQVLVDLIDLSKLQASIHVLERDAGALAVGKEVLLHLDAVPEEVFHGTIQKVSGSARSLETDSPLKYFTCQVLIHDLLDHIDLVKPGMTLEADIILEVYESCFVVPASAVTQKGGQALVHVLQGDAFIAKPVTLGAATHGQCTILEGVEEGETIALNNPFESQKAYLPDFSKGAPDSQTQPASREGGMRRPR